MEDSIGKVKKQGTEKAAKKTIDDIINIAPCYKQEILQNFYEHGEHQEKQVLK